MSEACARSVPAPPDEREHEAVSSDAATNAEPPGEAWRRQAEGELAWHDRLKPEAEDQKKVDEARCIGGMRPTRAALDKLPEVVEAKVVGKALNQLMDNEPWEQDAAVGTIRNKSGEDPALEHAAYRIAKVIGDTGRGH